MSSHRAKNPTKLGPLFNMLEDQHLRKLETLHGIGGTPERIVHLETLTDGNENQQTLVFGDVHSGNGIPSTQAVPREADSNNCHALWPIASLSKPLIAVVFARLVTESIKAPFKISWKMRVKHLTKECEKLGFPKTKELKSNPRLIDLLAHIDGVAEMNECILSPDGHCILTKEEFLHKFSDITSHKLRHSEPRSYRYSNGNYILAAFLLEYILDNDLCSIMNEYVFVPLGMNHTFMGRDPTKEEKENLIPGCHLDSSHMPRRVMVPSYQSTVGTTVFAAYSCLADLARFYRLLQSAFTGNPFKFLTRDFVESILFPPDLKQPDNLLGTKFNLNTSVTVSQSLNQFLLPDINQDGVEQYKTEDGEPVGVIRINGTIEGYSATVYWVWDLFGFVIVLGNSSGPLDVSDHLVHYLLQESCKLTPRVDIEKITRNQHDEAKDSLRKLEIEHKSDPNSDKTVEDIVGAYDNDTSGERITISVDMTATIGRSVKSGSFALVRPDFNELRLMEMPERPLTIESWNVWKDLSLEIWHNDNGSKSLIHKIGSEEREFIRHGA